MQVGKELAVDEIAQVITGQGFIVIELAVFALGRSPGLPTVIFIENEGISLSLQTGFVGFVLLQPVEVFQKQQPRSLFGVIQLGRAAGFFPQHIVDILEGLFKHG